MSTTSPGRFAHPTRLTAPTPRADAAFGWALALDADGRTLVVGAPFERKDVGAVYLFTRDQRAWSPPVAMPKPSGETLVGNAVALSADGQILAYGGAGDSKGAGAVHVVARQNGRWRPQAVLLAPRPTASAAFGLAIALSAAVPRSLSASLAPTILRARANGTGGSADGRNRSSLCVICA